MSTKNELAKSELTAISTQINSAHRECLSAMRSSIDHAIKAGDLLVQAKALVNHGDWLNWVSDNCSFSERTARAYMRVAKNKTAITADMTMIGALNMLSTPKTPLEKIKMFVNKEININIYITN